MVTKLNLEYNMSLVVVVLFFLQNAYFMLDWRNANISDNNTAKTQQEIQKNIFHKQQNRISNKTITTIIHKTENTAFRTTQQQKAANTQWNKNTKAKEAQKAKDEYKFFI